MAFSDIPTYLLILPVLTGIVLFIIWLLSPETNKKLAAFPAYLILLVLTSIVTGVIRFADGKLVFPMAWTHFRDYAAFLFAVVFFFNTKWFVRNSARDTFYLLFAFFILGASILLREDFVIQNSQLYQIGPGVVSKGQIGFFTLVAGWGIWIVWAFYFLVKSYRTTLYALHRNRFKYWYLILAINLAGTIFLLSGQPIAGSFMLSFSAALMVIITVRHELPDIRQITRRSTGFIIFSVFAIILYSTGFLIFYEMLGNVSLPAIIPALVLLAAVLVLVANPLIGLAQAWINRVLIGNNIDSPRILSEYSKSISSKLDLEQLASEIDTLIKNELGIRHSQLIVVSKIETGFVLKAVQNDHSTQSGILPELLIPEDSPLVEHFTRAKEPLTQYDVDFLQKYQNLTKVVRDWIGSIRGEVFIPVASQNEWIGILAMGPKNSGDRYFEDDINLLGSLADQTSIAVKNARLYNDLRIKNDENELLNSDLKAANQELSRLDQAKSDFISIASHEIRTPLTQIIGYNDILTDMVKGENIQRSAGLQMVDGVRKAAKRLEEIVDTMFDVSKLDTRTLDIEYNDVQISTVISNAYDRWNIALEGRRQTFIRKGLQNLPTLKGDDRRLGQVFSNLIQNAIKYTPDGGEIQVSAAYNTGNGILGAKPCIELQIKDTGIGIAAEDLERIFEKFYRVGNVMLHSSGETKFKGAGPGLGLTIARGIVEAHQGKIWAESPGHDEERYPGSTFHVVLPLF